MPVNEFRDMLSILVPENHSYNILAGFMLQRFGALSAARTNFDFQGRHFGLSISTAAASIRCLR